MLIPNAERRDGRTRPIPEVRTDATKATQAMQLPGVQHSGKR